MTMPVSLEEREVNVFFWGWGKTLVGLDHVFPVQRQATSKPILDTGDVPYHEARRMNGRFPEHRTSRILVVVGLRMHSAREI
jgi:hypothetical protein